MPVVIALIDQDNDQGTHSMMSKDRITENQSKKKVPGIVDSRHFLAPLARFEFTAFRLESVLQGLCNRGE